MIKRYMIHFIMGFSLIMLAACNQNTTDMDGTALREDIEQRSEDLGGTGNNVDVQRVGFRDNNTNSDHQKGRNVNNDRNIDTDRNLNITNVGTNRNRNNRHSQTLIVPTDGIQRVGNGFLTIESNSYRTTTPSKNFPHSKYVKRGQFSFYKESRPDRKGQEAGGQQGNQGNQGQNAAGQQSPAGQAPTNEAQQKPTQGISAAESRVIELTNAQRRKHGLKDLQADATLSNVARTKSNDMRTKNYFSHTSPTYGSPFDMIRDFGISYKSAGENIAKGQTSPEQVVDAWMNSEGHRKNILSADYTHIGVGYSESGNYWTQMFIRK